MHRILLVLVLSLNMYEYVCTRKRSKNVLTLFESG